MKTEGNSRKSFNIAAGETKNVLRVPEVSNRHVDSFGSSPQSSLSSQVNEELKQQLDDWVRTHRIH